MRYEALRYVPEADDPSLMIETQELVARIIDNTGLLAPLVESTSYLNTSGHIAPFVHHLGYHGIRTLYDKAERRNLVVPFVSWLNLQTATLEGIEPDPVDERAYAGMSRGWPMRLERARGGVILRLDPLPSMQMTYSLELQPAEPDGIDFSVRFGFGRRPESGVARFRATWPCYVNAYDDVRIFYPHGTWPDRWEWRCIGEKPDIVVGEPVGYAHKQRAYFAEDQALPVGYGRIGENALVLMFSDANVRLFVVNAGGHTAFSAVQNPAWDFEWIVEGYPLGQTLGFDGRLIYTRYQGAEQVLARYWEWRGKRR